MIIELNWAWTPDELPEGGKCGVCGFPVPAPAAVIVNAATDERDEMGPVCEECIAYLGSRNPEASPTLEEYWHIVAGHPHPMFSSREEMEAAAPEWEDPADTFWEASWLWTAEEHASA